MKVDCYIISNIKLNKRKQLIVQNAKKISSYQQYSTIFNENSLKY